MDGKKDFFKSTTRGEVTLLCVVFFSVSHFDRSRYSSLPLFTLSLGISFPVALYSTFESEDLAFLLVYQFFYQFYLFSSHSPLEIFQNEALTMSSSSNCYPNLRPGSREENTLRFCSHATYRPSRCRTYPTVESHQPSLHL